MKKLNEAVIIAMEANIRFPYTNANLQTDGGSCLMLLFYLNLLDTAEEKDKFTALYEKHRLIMLYTANNVLKDEYKAEDAVHEAFMRVMKNLHKISAVDCPQTKRFMVTIVRNVSLSMLKSSSYGKIEIPDDEAVETSESGFSLDDECLSKISFEVIVNEIMSLPDKYKDVLYLDCVMEMSSGEIAELLSIPNETTKKRIQRGKKILIEKLEKEGIVYAE